MTRTFRAILAFCLTTGALFASAGAAGSGVTHTLTPSGPSRVDAVAAHAARATAQRATVRYLIIWQRLDIRPLEEDGVIESIRKLCAPGNTGASTSYAAAAVQEDNPFLTLDEAGIVVSTSAKSYDGIHSVCHYFR